MNFEALQAKDFGSAPHAYTAKDTMLYALGVGAGADPLDEADLGLVTETDLAALPTMSCVLGTPGFWMTDPVVEIDHVRLLHGEQSIELLKPIPPEGCMIPTFRPVGVKDRGEGKAATLYFEKRLKDEGGEEVAVVRSTYMLRGDGGCGNHGEAFAAPLPMPESEPSRVIDVPTLDRQALLYRLNGDYNPLHSDPAVARAAGFDRPIMHGLGSMGLVCHALVRALCDGDPTRVTAMSLRFASPFYPGETMALECFGEGSEVRFRAKAKERDKVVLDLGAISIR
ncbi:MAG: MaoC/PaaZ C-terminal domain-containing protein [Novosphingobium sp.]|nr:MaoC/PaaZ C-terminal domain-containing protein [Novosphingobium sp.]